MTMEQVRILARFWVESPYFLGFCRLWRDWNGYEVYEPVIDWERDKLSMWPSNPPFIFSNDREAFICSPREKMEIYKARLEDLSHARRRKKRHLCPVCEHHCFPNTGPVDICPECGWHDDVRMERDPTLITQTSGNDLCLADYRVRYKRLCRLIPGYLWRIHRIPDAASHEEEEKT